MQIIRGRQARSWPFKKKFGSMRIFSCCSRNRSTEGVSYLSYGIGPLEKKTGRINVIAFRGGHVGRSRLVAEANRDSPNASKSRRAHGAAEDSVLMQDGGSARFPNKRGPRRYQNAGQGMRAPRIGILVTGESSGVLGRRRDIDQRIRNRNEKKASVTMPKVVVRRK